jgi:hypothetical protein
VRTAESYMTLIDVSILRLGALWVKSTASTVRESVPGVGQEVHSEGENNCGEKDTRSTLPANVGFS